MAKKVVKKVKNISVSRRHWGITILAILAYIGAIATLLSGLFMLFGSSLIASMFSKYISMMSATVLGAGLIITGIFFIACAVLNYFIARGLWKGQNWARIVMLVLLVLSALGALLSLQIVSLIVDAVLIWYLAYYKPAVNYFK